MYTMRFSPEAVGAASIANILFDTEQSEINEQKAKEQAQSLNGMTATASANLIKSSLDAQAQTTRSNGWGEIGAGLAQGGSEIGASAYEVGRNQNNDLEANSKAADRLEKWQEAVDKSDKADMVVKIGPPKAPYTADELTAAKNRLNPEALEHDVESESAPGRTYKEDLEAVKGAKDLANKDECLNQLGKTIKRQKESYQNKVENFTSATSKRTEKLRSFGQVAGNLARGFQSQNAAASTENQANQEMMKSQAQFAADSGKSNVDSMNKDLDNKKSVKDSSIQLMSSLIQENRV